MSATAMTMEAPLLSSPTAATVTATSFASSSADDISTTYPIATRDILVRLTAVFVLVALALWANHEASKSVEIYIVNSAAKSHSPAGRLFDLKFVSNGKAYRIVHRASLFVEQALYPDRQLYPRKLINRITLVLAGAGVLTSTASVSADAAAGYYTVYVSPALIAAADPDAALAGAVHWAVARLWLWDGQRAAPDSLLDAVAEYLARAAGYDSSFLRANASSSLESNASPSSSSSCWSAEFFESCEARRSGFIRRLNRGMRERWSDLAVEEARALCAAYKTAASAQVTMKPFNTTSDAEVAL